MFLIQTLFNLTLRATTHLDCRTGSCPSLTARSPIHAHAVLVFVPGDIVFFECGAWGCRVSSFLFVFVLIWRTESKITFIYHPDKHRCLSLHARMLKFQRLKMHTSKDTNQPSLIFVTQRTMCRGRREVCPNQFQARYSW